MRSDRHRAHLVGYAAPLRLSCVRLQLFRTATAALGLEFHKVCCRVGFPVAAAIFEAAAKGRSQRWSRHSLFGARRAPSARADLPQIVHRADCEPSACDNPFYRYGPGNTAWEGRGGFADEGIVLGSATNLCLSNGPAW